MLASGFGQVLDTIPEISEAARGNEEEKQPSFQLLRVRGCRTNNLLLIKPPLAVTRNYVPPRRSLWLFSTFDSDESVDFV